MNSSTSTSSEVGQAVWTNPGNDLTHVTHRGPGLRSILLRLSATLIALTGLAMGTTAYSQDDPVDLTDTSSSALAQETEPQSTPETIELTPAMEAAAQAHQSCVNAIMSTQSKAQEKREQIQNQCAEAEVALVAAFPEEIQQLVATDVNRQIESVLLSLEQIEAAVVESAEDSAEIAKELAALEEEQQALALAEVEALAAEEEQQRLQLPPPDGDEEQGGASLEGTDVGADG